MTTTMMTKARFIITLLLLAAAFSASAQFTLQGHIEYERKTNLYKLWEGNQWMEGFKDKVKPFATVFFNLAFTEKASRYSQGREGEVPKLSWGMPPGADNEIVRDFAHNTVTAAKNIYEEHFLIRDTVAQLQWRIAGEVRTIAGYTCRKAVARICDSVYIVAFFTNEIPISGGPEQIGGLPGMILELAVPRLYTTWVATKVEVNTVKDEELKAPSKGKALTHAALEKQILESLKDWGNKYSHRNVWWAML
jgi:GLPGLI family protein